MKWYEMPACDSTLIETSFILHEWVDTIWDPEQYKKTGLQRFCNKHGVKWSKPLNSLFQKMTKEDYNPNDDEGLKLYVEKNKQI